MPREHSSLCNGGWCNTVAAGRRTFRRVIGDVAVSRAGMGQHEQAPASRCSGRRVVLGKSAQGVGLYDGWQATVGGRASSKTADANRSQTGRWHLRDRAIPTTESGRSTRAAARCLLSACARRPSDSRRYWRRGCRPDRTQAPQRSRAGRHMPGRRGDRAVKIRPSTAQQQTGKCRRHHAGTTPSIHVQLSMPASNDRRRPKHNPQPVAAMARRFRRPAAARRHREWRTVLRQTAASAHPAAG